LQESLTKQCNHYNTNIAQSAQNQQQIYDALKLITEGVATMNDEVQVNRKQLMIAHTSGEDAELDLQNIHHILD
jgi:hypothetical protein